MTVRTLEKDRVDLASDQPEAKSWNRWHKFLAGVAVVAALGCNNPVKETAPPVPENNGTQTDTDPTDSDHDAGRDAGPDSDSDTDADTDTDSDTDADTDSDSDAGSDSGVDNEDGGAALDCSEPLHIDNLETDVSPFGNEVTVSWETNRPASTWLAMWTPPDSSIWPVYYTTPTTSHTVKIEANAGIVVDEDFAFYVSSEEIGECGVNHVDSAVQGFHTQKPHLLILLSPFYSNDAGLDDAIVTYSNVIAYEDWLTDVVKLDETTNDYTFIKELLADRKHNNNTPAAILVGEDLAFSFFDDGTNYMCPNLKGWTEIDRISLPADVGVIGSQYIDIALSLIAPQPSSGPYHSSINEVRDTFLKFAVNRGKYYPGKVAVYYDDDVFHEIIFHPPDYPELNLLGDVLVKPDATPEDVQSSKESPLDLLILNGHGNSQEVNAGPGVAFEAADIAEIDVPIAVLTGCHTYCWASLDGIKPFSVYHQFLGSLVSEDNAVQVVVGGYSAYYEGPLIPPNFISQAVPVLAEGKSLAQALYWSTSFNYDLDAIEHVVVYGDITFRYTQD